MKKAGRGTRPKQNKKNDKPVPRHEDFDSLLKSFKSTDPKGLSEKIIKNFILHTLYFFNLTLDSDKELSNILDAIEKKYGRPFRLQCDNILKVNKNQNTRSAQNKALQKNYELPLQLGVDGEYSYVRSQNYTAAALDGLRLFLSLKVGDDVNKRYKTPSTKDRKVTLLEVACGMNSTALVEDLIRLGANYKTQELSRNPLEICVRRNHLQTTTYLFEHNYVFVESELLLSEIYSYALRYFNIAILEMLLSHNLILKSELESTQENRTENPLLMLKFVKAICYEGESKEALRVFELFLRKGYRVDGVDEMGETVLSTVLTFKCFEVFKLIMLNARTSAVTVVNRVSVSGCTALTKAVSLADEGVVKQLLEIGADPNLPVDKKHLQPLSAARYFKNDSIAVLLQSHGVLETSFNSVVIVERSETLEVALQRPLMYAISVRNIQLTADILRGGDSPDFLLADLRSPLFYALICYLEADNTEQRQCSQKIFEILIEFGANVQCTLFHDRVLTPLQFCMKHDLPTFIPMLLSPMQINLQNAVHVDALSIACNENSVDSLKVYFRSGGDIPHDVHLIMGLLAVANRNNFYEISKELIIQLGKKLLTPEYQLRFFRLFSLRYLSLYEVERVAFKDRLMELLSYLDWFVGLPKKIEEGECDKGISKILEEMRGYQAKHENFRAFVIDKLLKYFQHYQINLTCEFNSNLVRFTGEFSRFQLIERFVKLGVVVCKTENDFFAGMFFPYPTKEFIDDFNRLVSTENYLEYKSGGDFSKLIGGAGELTVGQQLHQIALAALTLKSKSSDPCCWQGLVSHHHPDVHSIKYTDDYVVLLNSILESQGLTNSVFNKLKTVNRLGSNNVELIARLEGDPLFQEIILENGIIQRIPLTHRLTLALALNDNYCSIALGAVLADDQQHIFYVGLQFFNNALTEPEHLAELAERCKKPISIIHQSHGVLCIDNN